MSFTLALLFILNGAQGCPKLRVLAPGNYLVPGAMGDVVYRDDQTLDAYAPPGEPEPWAIIFHGSRGNKRTHVTQLFDVLTRAGFAWFSLDYRSLEDARAAVDYIRCPGRFNIRGDPVLIGEDTGAAIALSLAASGPARGVVAFGTKPAGTGGTKDATSPDVPVLMFHGTADEEVPVLDAKAKCEKMRNCTFRAEPGAIHEFENWRPDQWAWKEELAVWLRGDRRGLWKDIVYARPEGLEQRMDAFIPEGGGPFPAVIIVHGGGWEAGDKVTYVSPVFEPLAQGGFAWFSVDYRLTPYVRVGEELEDLRAAIRFLRRHASWFHIDPERLALLGESASGYLVTQVASEPCPSCDVQAVVAFYGVYDFTRWTERADERRVLDRLFGRWTPDDLRRYSPVSHARADLPPMLIIQGTADELYDQAKEYTTRLKEARAQFELLLLDGAPHGMENWEGHPEWMFYKKRLVDWLKLTLNSPARWRRTSSREP